MALLRKLIIGHFQKKRYINSDENNTQIKGCIPNGAYHFQSFKYQKA
jgi:hypothetical protein